MFVTISIQHHREAGTSKHAKRNLADREWLHLSSEEALQILCSLGEDVGVMPIASELTTE